MCNVWKEVWNLIRHKLQKKQIKLASNSTYGFNSVKLNKIVRNFEFRKINAARSGDDLGLSFNLASLDTSS